MFPATIVDLTDGAVDHDYDTLWSDGRKVVRKDIASTPALPTLLTIQHAESGSGLTTKQSSNVRFDRTVALADGTEGLIEVYSVIRYPVKIATAAQVLEVTKQMVDFLNTGTNAAMLINGEQ